MGDSGSLFFETIRNTSKIRAAKHPMPTAVTADLDSLGQNKGQNKGGTKQRCQERMALSIAWFEFMAAAVFERGHGSHVDRSGLEWSWRGVATRGRCAL